MIVFDIDDTLYKERDYVASGHRAVERHLAARGLDPGLARGIWTNDMRQAYQVHQPEIELTADARAALDHLKRRGVRIGIITDGRSVTQRAKIRALGLEDYVDPGNIIISGETGHEKTAPYPFEEMMRRNPGETRFTYIGDNPVKDFMHPNRLGWTTVMLADTDGLNTFPQTRYGDDRDARATTNSIANYINENPDTL